MTTLEVTNDDLGAHLAAKRRSEVYRHASDLEILQRERSKMEYFLACYVGVALCIAFAIGAHPIHVGIFIPWLLILWYGAFILIRKGRKLDGYFGLLASRGKTDSRNDG
jgi:hypothetical protein